MILNKWEPFQGRVASWEDNRHFTDEVMDFEPTVGTAYQWNYRKFTILAVYFNYFRFQIIEMEGSVSILFQI